MYAIKDTSLIFDDNFNQDISYLCISFILSLDSYYLINIDLLLLNNGYISYSFDFALSHHQSLSLKHVKNNHHQYLHFK